MTGKSFITAIGADYRKFPKVSSTLFLLYDEKNRIDNTVDVQFVEPLFINNPDEKERCLSFLSELEKNPVRVIRIKIDKFHVILFYLTPKANIFYRFIPLEPLDYME